MQLMHFSTFYKVQKFCARILSHLAQRDENTPLRRYFPESLCCAEECKGIEDYVLNVSHQESYRNVRD